MRGLCLWVGVVVAGVIPAFSAARGPDPAHAADVVDAAAVRALATPGAAGLSVCVRVDGRTVLCKGYGVADGEDGRAVGPGTMFHACSVSKQFLAAAIMRLAERGRLGLDDPITRHLPEFVTPGRTVTLRQLLTHTSGLKGYTELERFKELEGRDLTHEEVLALVSNEPPLFAPGERFVYCNTGPYLLGMAVERVSGKDYGSFMRGEFFAPLGLSRTCYDPRCADPDVAVPHHPKDGRPVHAAPIAWSNAFAGGGLLSTAGDLAAWMDSLSAGKVVSADSFRQMTTVQRLNDGTPSGYGFYLFVREHGGHPVVFHTGTGPGCSAWVADYPEDHLVIAVMSNSGAVWAPRLGIAMAMAVFGVDTTPRDLPLSARDQARYSGRFRWEPWEDEPAEDQISRFYAKDGHLWIEASRGRTSRLLFQGSGAFVVEAAPTVIITFDENTPGTEAGGLAGTCASDDGVHAEIGRRVPD
jgi:CubicO group peptidase (beta-lactamase class C family)